MQSVEPSWKNTLFLVVGPPDNFSEKCHQTPYFGPKPYLGVRLGRAGLEARGKKCSFYGVSSIFHAPGDSVPAGYFPNCSSLAVEGGLTREGAL